VRMDAHYLEAVRRQMLKQEPWQFINWPIPYHDEPQGDPHVEEV
jgi:hypothetical protein